MWVADLRKLTTVLSDPGLALGVAHAQQPGCSWGFRGAERFVKPLGRVRHFAQNIRISASKLNAEPLTLGLIKIGETLHGRCR